MLKQDNGLLFKNLLIDPHKKPFAKKVLLSHAHSDHVKLSAEPEFYCTPETADLVLFRFPRKKYELKLNSINFNKQKKFETFSIELFGNGHILGSAQTKISDISGKDIVVTSDFRLEDSLLFKGAKPLSSDILVLETTFGMPQYSFPSYFDVVDEMVDWISNNTKTKLVILAGYSLGKAQELTKISNLAGIVPIVHESIFEINEIYKKHGVDVGDYVKMDHNLKDSQVLIMPPSLVNRYLFSTLEHFDKREIISAMATGWDYKGYFDKIFHLSNHADFNQLMEYVKQANPKLVFTDHGFCHEFARKLNRKGFNAKPLKQHKQKILGEF
jgi:Cft2 family RNA processing exonuclease